MHYKIKVITIVILVIPQVFYCNSYFVWNYLLGISFQSQLHKDAFDHKVS
jgi:hypothetical protein